VIELRQLFTKPSAIQIARQELADAEVALLAARPQKEYAIAMVSFREAQVQRLAVWVKKQQTNEGDEQ